ncbi:MAG: Crp/Fnr family transcriptional regulator [Alphaproteobacteria bacterium]|nr:Crp/Fnr family transcriptional regulator [Alphaproteobacteria bacterium]
MPHPPASTPGKSASQTLAQVSLFAALPPTHRQAIERRCRWRTYKEDEQIIDRETDTQDVFFVVAGKARVVNYSPAGREVSFDEIGPGGCFGELASIDGQPRSAAVVAIRPTLAASLSAAVFREILESNPTVAQALLRRLAEVVRESTDRIMDLSTLGAHNRVYAELLREARDSDPTAFERITNQASIRPIPVHSDIAARVSTTRETVARVLGELARKGIVERESDALVLRDVARLTKMVREFRAD